MNSPLTDLFQKYLANECTPEETETLFRHFNIPENEQLLHDLILAELYNDNDLQDHGEEHQYLLKKAHSIIIDSISLSAKKEAAVKPLFSRRGFRSVAAAILFILAGGLLLLLYRSKPHSVPVVKNEKTIIDQIVPGADKAVLTLADGRSVVLDSMPDNGQLMQGNTRIIKQAGGQLSYTAGSHAKDTEIRYNVMSTPRGGQFRLVLPDGSKVWLNAASSIRFPTLFAGNERKVTITGEAYFEVKHDASNPFKVEANGTEVTVLGTHFNINAYPDEKSVRTTLMEGSVRVGRLSGHAQAATITPGEQAEFLREEAAPVRIHRDVDLEEVLGWKNNAFVFNNQDVESIMRQISRWYDVDVVYEKQGFTETFSGLISRKSNIEDVLKILKEGGLQFKLDKRKITVM